MKEVNMEAWARKAHFDFFSSFDLPFYNTSFNLDITGLKECARRLGVSINHSLVYLTIKAMSPIINFRYRIEHGKVIEYEELHPSFTHIKPGEDLFHFVTVPFQSDLQAFDALAKQKISDRAVHLDVSEREERTNFVFMTSLPWIPFTAIDHAIHFDKDDSVPRVAWGKFFEDRGRTLLPYNIRVNHRFIDGIHVGHFYENLVHEVRDLLAGASQA